MVRIRGDVVILRLMTVVALVLLAGCAPGEQAPAPAAPAAPPTPAAPAAPDGQPATDPLLAACLGGTMVACDDLYREAPSGTAEEVVGDTCGGRQLAGSGVWCVDLDPSVPHDPDDEDPAEQPLSEPLIEQCLRGIFDACDDVYRYADPGTVDRVVGDTCGGRQIAGTGEWCVDVFGPDGQPTPSGAVGACIDGDFERCDELFRASSPRTAPRVVGDTCGGRQIAGTGEWCVDVFGTSEPAVDGQAPAGSDPELAELSDACAHGDMEACDLLLITAPADSTEAEFGDTCGGRQPAGTDRWCVDAFGG